MQRAQVRLGQRVAGLEQKLNRSAHGRRSERVIANNRESIEPQLPRSRSLEMLDKMERAPLQATRFVIISDNLMVCHNNCCARQFPDKPLSY